MALTLPILTTTTNGKHALQDKQRQHGLQWKTVCEDVQHLCFVSLNFFVVASPATEKEHCLCQRRTKTVFKDKPEERAKRAVVE